MACSGEKPGRPAEVSAEPWGKLRQRGQCGQRGSLAAGGTEPQAVLFSVGTSCVQAASLSGASGNLLKDRREPSALGVAVTHVEHFEYSFRDTWTHPKAPGSEPLKGVA